MIDIPVDQLPEEVPETFRQPGNSTDAIEQDGEILETIFSKCCIGRHHVILTDITPESIFYDLMHINVPIGHLNGK